MVSQAERRASTRSAVLDASVECLVEVGLAGYTVNEVRERSGLSNGAVYRYFPTKIDMLSATVEELLRRSRENFQQRFAAMGTDGFSPEVTARTLWEVMTTPEFLAIFDTYAAARTDEALRGGITEVLHQHAVALRDLAGGTLIELGVPEANAHAAARLAIYAIQGRAMVQPVTDGTETAEELMATLAMIGRSMFAMPSGT